MGARRIAATITAGVLAVGLGACDAAKTVTSAPTTTTTQRYVLTGTLSVNGTAGEGRYADISDGGPVDVSDAAGARLGSGTLVGDLTNQTQFRFTVMNLPKSAWYRIDIGRDRDPVSYTFQQLQAAGWSVALTLG